MPKGVRVLFFFMFPLKGRNRDVFSTDLLSEPLLRVFDSGSSDLDEPNPFHCQSSLPFNKPMLLWSSFFIIKKVTGIQIIHCSVDSFNKFLVSEAHTLSIGHRIGTLGSLPSIRIGRISLKSFCTLPQSRRSILYQEHCFQCFYRFYHWPGRPLLCHRTLTPIHS